MKRLLCLCLLLLATPATGAVRTYHVGIGGSNANTGVTYAQRWATVDRANEVVNTSIGGTDYDILVKLYPADSTRADTAYNLGALPDPVNAATGGKRYYYRAAALNGPIPWGHPNVSVNGGTLSKNYVSIRGVKIDGELTVTGKRDSIAGCVVSGTVKIKNAYYDVINGCRLNGPMFWVNAEAQAGETKGFELSDSHLPNLNTNGGWGCCGEGCAAGTHGFWLEQHVDSSFFYRNRATIKNDASSVANAPLKIKYTKNTTFRGNRFDIEIGAVCGNEEGFYFYYRDSCIANVFRSDTFFVNNVIPVPDRTVRSVFPGSGNWSVSCKDLTLDSCFFKLNKGELIWMNAPVRQWTVTNSIFFCGESHGFFTNLEMLGRNTFDHNTFVANVPPTWIGYRCFRDTLPNGERVPCTVNSCCDGCRTDENSNGANIFWNAKPDTAVFVVGSDNIVIPPDTTVITNNIFVNTYPGHIVQTNYFCDRPFAAFYQFPNTRLVLDWNVYYTASYQTTPGDGCIGYKDGGGMHGSAPGDNTPFETAYPNKDRRSIYGDPWLGGTSATELRYSNFNPRPGVFSAAKTSGKSGSTSGAVAYSGLPKVSLSQSDVKFFAAEPGWSAVQTIVISNLTEAGDDLELSDAGFDSGDEYLDYYFSKTTIAPGDTAALVITIAEGPASGVGRWSFSFLTNDLSTEFTATVSIPIDFREPRQRGELEP